MNTQQLTRLLPRSALTAIAAGALLALAGCNGMAVRSSSTVDSQNVAYAAPENKEKITFPDRSSAWLTAGTFIDVEQLRRIGRGMSKNQVRELISYPHFAEGLFGPKEWDYIFNFRTGVGDEFITCQYKVVFVDGKSDRMYWKEPECADQLRVAKAVVAPPPPPPAPVPVPTTERLRLSADALFKFDKSGTDDILPEGRRQLDALAAQLAGQYKSFDSIVVIGHTDRLGSDSYNQALSVARANTVRKYLIDKGLPARPLRSYGVGETQPVTTTCGTSEKANPTLIACLQPDRRVELDITGYR